MSSDDKSTQNVQRNIKAQENIDYQNIDEQMRRIEESEIIHDQIEQNRYQYTVLTPGRIFSEVHISHISDVQHLSEKGDEAFNRGEYKSALTFYINAEALAHSDNNFVQKSFINAKMANTLIKLGDYDKAATYYRKATELVKDKENPSPLNNPQFALFIPNNSRDIKTAFFIFVCFLILLGILYESVFLKFLTIVSPLLIAIIAEVLVIAFWGFTVFFTKSISRKGRR